MLRVNARISLETGAHIRADVSLKIYNNIRSSKVDNNDEDLCFTSSSCSSRSACRCPIRCLGAMCVLDLCFFETL